MTVKFGPKSTEMGDIYKLISLSRISLLGYTTKYEAQKDEIILNLNCTKIYPGDPIFSIKRDFKISEILDMYNPITRNLVIDMCDIRQQNFGALGGAKEVLYTIKSIRDQIRDDDFKLIIVTQIYNNINVNPTFSHNSLLYSCDLAFTLGDGGINIIKNRYR